MLRITITDTTLGSRLERRLTEAVRRLGQQLEQEIRDHTPVATGRARSGWRRQDRQRGFTIENQVPYIGVLDRGRHMTNRGMRGSRQAPRGIVGPSLKSIKGKN